MLEQTTEKKQGRSVAKVHGIQRERGTGTTTFAYIIHDIQVYMYIHHTFMCTCMYVKQYKGV